MTSPCESILLDAFANAAGMVEAATLKDSTPAQVHFIYILSLEGNVEASAS